MDHFLIRPLFKRASNIEGVNEFAGITSLVRDMLKTYKLVILKYEQATIRDRLVKVSKRVT